jgi:hypothetical protein
MDSSKAGWNFREKRYSRNQGELLELKSEKVTQVCISHLQPFK